MQPNEIKVTTEEGVIVARVEAAHLDEEHAQSLLQQLLTASAETPGAPILVNMSKVVSMPSMAIGALVTLWKKSQDSKQRLVLAGMQGSVRNTLTVCRLDKFFEFCESEQEGRKRVHGPGAAG
jgi:anti-anti-sigma factor